MLPGLLPIHHGLPGKKEDDPNPHSQVHHPPVRASDHLPVHPDYLVLQFYSKKTFISIPPDRQGVATVPLQHPPIHPNPNLHTIQAVHSTPGYFCTVCCNGVVISLEQLYPGPVVHWAVVDDFRTFSFWVCTGKIGFFLLPWFWPKTCPSCYWFWFVDI